MEVSRCRLRKLAEIQILNRYVEIHGELPPANTKWEGWLVARFLVALAAQSIHSTSFKWHHGAAYDWPSGHVHKPAASTCVDFFSDRDEDQWVGTLGWIWPARWQEEDRKITARTDGGEQIDLRGYLFVAAPKASVGASIPDAIRPGWQSGSRLAAWMRAPGLSGSRDDGNVMPLVERLLNADTSGSNPVAALVALLGAEATSA